MSYITTVVGCNIKGQTFNRQFGPLSVIFGESMSGKTALLDALRLAWVGTTLGVGKRSHEIFNTLASSDSLTASIYFDDGASVERTWSIKGDKVSGQVRNPLNLTAPPVLLDSREFFDLPSEARLALLFSRLNLGAEPIQMRVGKLLDRMSDNQAARDLLSKKYKANPQETFQAYLERTIEKVGDEAKEQNASAKRYREAAAGMIEAQLRAEAEGVPTYQEDEVKSDMASAKKFLEDLLAERGSVQARQQGRAPSLERRAKLHKSIQDYQPRSVALENYQKGVDDANAALASYADKETTEFANARVNEILERKHISAGTKEAKEKELRSLQSEYAAILQAECCPTCHTKKATWKAAATEVFEFKQKQLTEEIETLEAELQAIANERAEADKALAAAYQVEKAVRAATAALNEQTRQLEQSKTAREFIAEMTPELEDLDRAFPPDAADKDAQEISHISDRIEDARLLVAEQETRLQRIADIRLEAKRLTETTALRDRAQALAESYKRAQQELQTVRDEFMADAFKPLLVSVNRFAAGILKSPLEFRANTLGRMSDKGRWIPSAGFSGTETAIFLAGVQLALGSESPTRVAIVDELGRIDANRKRQLVRNIAQAISDGHLDQFIGVDLDDAPYVELIHPKNVTVPSIPITMVRVAATN